MSRQKKNSYGVGATICDIVTLGDEAIVSIQGGSWGRGPRPSSFFCEASVAEAFRTSAYVPGAADLSVRPDGALVSGGVYVGGGKFVAHCGSRSNEGWLVGTAEMVESFWLGRLGYGILTAATIVGVEKAGRNVSVIGVGGRICIAGEWRHLTGIRYALRASRAMIAQLEHGWGGFSEVSFCVTPRKRSVIWNPTGLAENRVIVDG